MMIMQANLPNNLSRKLSLMAFVMTMMIQVRGKIKYMPMQLNIGLKEKCSKNQDPFAPMEMLTVLKIKSLFVSSRNHHLKRPFFAGSK